MLPIECSNGVLVAVRDSSTKHQSRTTVPCVGIAEAGLKEHDGRGKHRAGSRAAATFIYGLFVELA